MSEPSVWILIAIGLVSGVFSGTFGIGGGIIMVPALVYLAGFTQHRAIGTSLAILLPPVSLTAVLEYYRHGNVDIRTAVVVALALFTGAYLGAYGANRLSGPHLRLIFGVFIICMGVYLCLDAMKRMEWL